MDRVPCRVEQDLRAYYKATDKEPSEADREEATTEIVGELLCGEEVGGLMAGDFIIEEMNPPTLAKCINDICYGNETAAADAVLTMQTFAQKGIRDYIERHHYNFIEHRLEMWAEDER